MWYHKIGWPKFKGSQSSDLHVEEGYDPRIVNTLVFCFLFFFFFFFLSIRWNIINLFILLKILNLTYLKVRHQIGQAQKC